MIIFKYPGGGSGGFLVSAYSDINYNDHLDKDHENKYTSPHLGSLVDNVHEFVPPLVWIWKAHREKDIQTGINMFKPKSTFIINMYCDTIESQRHCIYLSTYKNQIDYHPIGEWPEKTVGVMEHRLEFADEIMSWGMQYKGDLDIKHSKLMECDMDELYKYYDALRKFREPAINFKGYHKRWCNYVERNNDIIKRIEDCYGKHNN